MEQIKLSEKVSVSRLVHGVWRLADWQLNTSETTKLIAACLEMGIDTFDHADIYGDYSCERLFGDALAEEKSLSQRLKIISKCGIKLLSDKHPDTYIKHYDTSYQHILFSAENSLRNLRRDHLDVLLIHRPDPYINPEEVAEAFTELRQSGKVLEFGVSNFLTDQFDLLQSYLDFPLVTNQIEISALHVEHFQNGVINQCMKERISPMAWSPLAGGKYFEEKALGSAKLQKVIGQLATKYQTSEDQILYAWLYAHPAKIIPIVGSGKLSRIQAAVDANQIKLSRQEWFEIWTAAVGHEVP